MIITIKGWPRNPDPLRGEELRLTARSFVSRRAASEDGFGAISNDRPYGVGMPADQVGEILCDEAGSQWYAQTIDAFFAPQEEINEASSREKTDCGFQSRGESLSAF